MNDLWFISVIAAILSGGLAGALVRYYFDVRKQRIDAIFKLHDEWWKEDFRNSRTLLYKIVEDVSKREEFLIKYRDKELPPEELDAFARIAFFLQI